MRPVRFAIFGALVLAGSAAAVVARAQDIAGQVLGMDGDSAINLPLLKSDYDVDIQGDVARIELRQTFANPSLEPMQARYLFPLNQNAAVHAMRMQIGDELVEAVIQKKAQAQATFKAAQTQGKAAALLTQHRPNMFTQNIANLMPGQEIEVTLSYVQAVPKIDGAYELVIPMVVGPRYMGAQGRVAPLDDRPQQVSGWSIQPPPAHPATVGVDLPDSIEDDRVTLDLRLTSPLPVHALSSGTHSLAITEGAGVYDLSFAQGRVIDNADFVLRYALGGDAMTAGVLTHRDDDGGVVSLMIEPPQLPDANTAAARELVFVLDTSGSMGGAPMAASKRFMKAALEGLRPLDYFRIISFSNDARQFSEVALPATPGNLAQAQTHVRRLSAGGGTKIARAVRTAFDTRQPDNTMRIVVFLSDGYIGDEATVLRTIRERIDQARIYAFGVGSSVNRYLLDAMADEGRGYARYVGLDESALEVAETLARDLKTPLLTDISVDWGDAGISDATPTRLPDLFAGGSLRLFGKFTGSGKQTVTINGRVQGRAASLPLEITLPGEDTGKATEALRLMWARKLIGDHERAIAVRDGNAKTHETAITTLGLTHGLQTRFTSFVAVSKQVVNDRASSEAGGVKDVALHKPKGVSNQAFATPANAVVGSSTPEPETIIGAALLGSFGVFRFHISRRRTRRLAVQGARS